MANLKAIRDRDSSVKNTRKITEASVWYWRAAQVRRGPGQCCAPAFFAIVGGRCWNLQSRLRFRGMSANTHAAWNRGDPPPHHPGWWCRPDRGLCGGITQQFIKAHRTRFAELQE